MAVVVVMVVVGVAVASVTVALALRTLVLDNARTDARLHAPDAHTVSYAVPHGTDPVGLVAAARSAGFAAVVETTGREERVVVECDPGVRERLRAALASAAAATAPTTTAVVFDDER